MWSSINKIYITCLTIKQNQNKWKMIWLFDYAGFI